MGRRDFHVHTAYSDGADTPEALRMYHIREGN